jgi:hypothetical protein
MRPEHRVTKKPDAIPTLAEAGGRHGPLDETASDVMLLGKARPLGRPCR